MMYIYTKTIFGILLLKVCYIAVYQHTRTHTTYVISSSAIAKSTARPSCLVDVLYDISREKIC